MLDRKKYPAYHQIEDLRKKLLARNEKIEVEDLGAGSSVVKGNLRTIASIADTSLKPAKYAQLLYRMVQHYQPATIIELGTSLGITTCYLASANPNAKVYTIEGSASIADISRENFVAAGLKNIELITGNFDDVLPGLLKKIERPDLVYIDGNHRKEPTLHYFEQIRPELSANGLMIFDDIHWSGEMETAWQDILEMDDVRLSIDLFFIGIVSMDTAFKNKQHFKIRF